MLRSRAAHRVSKHARRLSDAPARRQAFRGKTMRSAVRVLAAALLAAGLAACDSYDDDIAAVQAAETMPGTSNAELVNQIAGARGKVEWSAGKSETYKDNADIVEVTATVEKPAADDAMRTVVMAWINNRQTRQVELERMLIDGEPQSLVSGALNLLLMQLE